MPNLLMIRGTPGTGKRTVSQILATKLGWRLFWLHDIDPIYKVVGNHRVPRLQDEISEAILRHLCKRQENVIFVRSARDRETCRGVKGVTLKYKHKFTLVTLKADYPILLERVRQRPDDPYRIHDREGLDEYLAARPEAAFDGEHVIHTDALTVEQVAEKILVIAKLMPVSV